MNKLILPAALAATVLAVGAAHAQAGAALSNTGSAIKEKAAQAVDATTGAYHETMAERAASATQADIEKGDMQGAAENAKSAAEHKVKATTDKTKAEMHRKAAASHSEKAKAAAGAK